MSNEEEKLLDEVAGEEDPEYGGYGDEEYDESNLETSNSNVDADATELENIQKELAQLANSQKKIIQMQKAEDIALKTQDSGNGDVAGVVRHLTAEEKEEIDSRSVYVGQVDFSATPIELQNHFQSCGLINRVTILCDKFTGRPKGYAYVEFMEADSVDNALLLNDSTFKSRQIKVIRKRTNVPSARGRGRGAYRGMGRGGHMMGRGRGGFPPRGRGFVPRGRGYHPYY